MALTRPIFLKYLEWNFALCSLVEDFQKGVTMTSGKADMFRCVAVDHRYQLGSTHFSALTRMDLNIKSGRISCLTGPSGSGKSTLLKILGLIEPLQKGEVFLNGSPISRLSEREKNHLRRLKLGFVFQNFILFEALTAVENVEYFLKNRELNRVERRERAMDALQAVGLESYAHHLPLRMSGGQRQRVAIARALAKEPEVMIADEPTASLDQSTGREIMAIFAKLVDEKSLTIVMASHDSMAVSFAQDVISLRDGQLDKILHSQTRS